MRAEVVTEAHRHACRAYDAQCVELVGVASSLRVVMLRRCGSSSGFSFVVVIVLLAIQLIPYGRDHANPPTVQEPKWSTPATRQLAQDGCFDCHSNLTEWPWYTNVAPVSWLTKRDVDDGRAALNFSEWQRPQEADLEEVIDAIRSKDMPPPQYRLIHADARLSERAAALEAGTRAMQGLRQLSCARAGSRPRDGQRRRPAGRRCGGRDGTASRSALERARTPPPA